MIDYYNTYKNFHGLNKENSSQDNVINNTKRVVEDSFNYSLLTEKVLVDGVEYDALVKQEKKSEDKKLIFKPDTKINIGSIIKFNNIDYLTMDFLGEGINEVYPTATIKVCNSLFPIITNKSTVLLRDDEGNLVYDDLTGEPIEVESGGTTTIVPCIVENKYRVDDSNNQLTLPENELLITLPFYPEIKLDYKFSLYDESFKVINLDRTKVINNKGVLSIRVRREVNS